MDRDRYEGDLAQVCQQQGLACVPYWSLAQGFLTGKYSVGRPRVESERTEMVDGDLDERGMAVLAALAWLVDQPTVVAPIASARTAGQLADLVSMVEIRLSAEELDRLGSAATAPR
jgi:aryl-alcohol dehydrogenase-like predicted oxidoreductase